MFENQHAVAINSVLGAIVELGESIHFWLKHHDPEAYLKMQKRDKLLTEYAALSTDAARADFWLKHAVDIEL